jgi:hypothetical protein
MRELVAFNTRAEKSQAARWPCVRRESHMLRKGTGIKKACWS